MKKLKVLSILLTATMALSLTACGGKEKESNQATEQDSNQAAEQEDGQDTDQESASKYKTSVEGQLTMATNAQFPPYEFYQGDKIVGIDAEIAGAIAEKLGLEIVIEDMEFDSIITAVKTGKADMGLAGITVTPERMEEVNFTDTYATGVQAVIVTEDSDIKTVDDLFAEGANNVVGVQRNTTGDIYATGDIEEAGLGSMDRYSKGADAVMALKTGKVDCVIIDNEPAKAFVSETDGIKLLDTQYAEEDYAAAMSKDNTELYEAVQGALAELIEDGTVAAIVEKYIPAK